MSGNHENRVLNRIGALELTKEETEKIMGTGIATRASLLPTGPTTSPDHIFDS